MLLVEPQSLLSVNILALLTTYGISLGFHTHLQLHMHTAGQSLSCYILYGISGQAVAVTPVLHGLDKLTLQGNFQL